MGTTKIILAFVGLMSTLAMSSSGTTFPGKKLVSVCYPSDEMLRIGCQNFNKKMEGCGFEVLAIDNKSVDDITKSIAEKNWPPTVPSFLNAHGADIDESMIAVPEKQGEKLKRDIRIIEPKNSALRRTETVLDAIQAGFADGKKDVPMTPKWVSACQSGGSCKKGNCTAAECAASETTLVTPDTRIGFVNTEIAGLLCEEKKFKNADADGNHILESNEINAHLCRVLGGRLEKRELYATKKIADWNVPGFKIKGFVKSIDDIPDDFADLKKKGFEVKAKRLGTAYRIHYKDADAKAKFFDFGDLFDGDQWKDNVVKAVTKGAWPAECGELLPDRPVKATDCRLEEGAVVYALEARDPKGPACFTAGNRIQNPALGDFKLYSPFVAAQAPGLPPARPRGRWRRHRNRGVVHEDGNPL